MNPDTTSQVLRIDNMSKSFGGRTALDQISFSVPAGSLTVILGPAGAGKTTTLRTVAGLDGPDKGRVLLEGRDTAGVEPKDRNVAMIFDNLALYPNKTGFENIASPLRIQRLPQAEIEARVSDIARTLKIPHILHRLPKTMSGGERQRVALGRALVRSPRLFLLDEPLSSLDAKLRIELRAELRRLQREQGNTFLMATPDFHEALAIADSVIMLRRGSVVQIAQPQDLYDNPVDLETAAFVGAPCINSVSAHVDTGKLTTLGVSMPLPEHFGALPAGQEFTLGIRPENIQLRCPKCAALVGRLADIEALGLKSVLTMTTAGCELRLVVESRDIRCLTVGAEIGADIADPARLLAFDTHSGRNICA